MWFIGDNPNHSSTILDSLEGGFAYYDVNFKAKLPANKQVSILDYGSGPGAFLKYAHGLGYTKLTGFEPDERYAEFLRKTSGAEIVSQQDIEGFLRSHQGKFDFIFCREVLYYFPRNEIQKWVSLLCATLKPQGTLLLEVYNGAGFSGHLPYLNDPYIQNIFTEFSLRSLVKNSGVEVLSLVSEHYPQKGIKQRLWLQSRGLWAWFLKLIYILERGIDERNPKLFGKSLILHGKKVTDSSL